MWVTLIADASHCPVSNFAGYGGRVSCKRGKKWSDGIIPGHVPNSTVAEMQAVLLTLSFGISEGLIKKHDNVLIQSDCTPALSAFKRRRGKLTELELSLIEEFETLGEVHNLHYRLKHVKGHSVGREPRFVVNNICDQRARANMRKARDLFYTKDELNENN